MLPSEKMREISAESDCLHYGMGWSRSDLDKPQIMIQSCYGESHPGSSHLLGLSGHVRDGVLEAGCRPCAFIVTDMCDGVAQGSDGGRYSLLSREFMTGMIEIQARSTLCDGLVLLSSCDKSVPAHINAAARLGLPAVIMPGGCMSAGAGFDCCDRMWELRRQAEAAGEDAPDYGAVSMTACPTAGACQQFGTAGTMQAMAEALGLAMPGSALIPAANMQLGRAARAAGNQVCELVKRGIGTGDILCREAFENAITVHAAIGGSSNAFIHLMAAAREAGVELTMRDFDRIHRRTPYLTNTLSTGKYPTEYFWYAGGIPALMWEIRDLLDLNVPTVTGSTLGENLEAMRSCGVLRPFSRFLQNVGVEPDGVIHPRRAPIATDGGVAILFGNLAPEGALIKHSAVSPDLRRMEGRAWVYDNEDSAIADLLDGRIGRGEIIVVNGQGPRGNGMPELFRLGDLLAQDETRRIAVVTDGRYSGCTRGPAVGYVCPEAANGGAIGLVRTGDVLRIDIPGRSLELIRGEFRGQTLPGDELLNIRLAQEPPQWPVPTGNGVLEIYRRLAGSALLGAVIEPK